MNPSSVALVQSSFSQAQALGSQAGEVFYQTLFTRAPALRPLFKGDIAAQSETLMRMIGVAVSQLHDVPALLSVLQRLAARHPSSGVMPAHHDAVGAALLQTLASGLGPAWTPPVRDAWTEVNTLMAGVMVQASAYVTESAMPAATAL